MFDVDFENQAKRQTQRFVSQSSVCRRRRPATDVKYQRFNPRNLRETSSSDMTTRTIRYKLNRPAEASGVEVVYTNDVFEAENWLRKHIVDSSAWTVGFDIEWKPHLFVSKRHRRGPENKTAVLQLGVEASCLVLHIYHMSELPTSLVSILRDENILKVGVGIQEDVLKLQRHRGLICKGMADIQAMGMKSLGLAASAPKVGLKALAECFVGIELTKLKWIAISNWEDFPLTLLQIEYAAMDAWAGWRIYQELKRQKDQHNF